jgi:hypothetical protein
MYSCEHYDIFIKQYLVDCTITCEERYSGTKKAEFISLLLMKNLNSYLNLCIHVHPHSVIDLAVVKNVPISIEGIVTGNINCYCVDLVTYKKYYTCPNVHFEAVYIASNCSAEIVLGVKKIYTDYSVRSLESGTVVFDGLYPDALIIYSFTLKPYDITPSENILCYVFEYSMLVNTAHELYGLIDEYCSVGDSDVDCDQYPFKYIRKDHKHEFIDNLDLESAQLIKNARK